MAYYPTHANYASPGNNNPSIGVHPDHRNVGWMLNSPTSPSIVRRDDSLESIGQFGFSDAFSQHEVRRENSFGSSSSSKRVKWKKNVKSGRKTVGCAAFQQGCSAFPSAFEETPTLNDSAASQKSLLQRFADVTIGNVQKCGIGIGKQCDGKGVNMSALKSLVGGEMCMRCGVNDDDAFGFANGKCPQCQNNFRARRNTRSRGVGYSQPIIYQLNAKHHANMMSPLQETQDAITQRRDSIVASPMQTRLDVLRTQEMKTQQYSYARPEIQGITRRQGECGQDAIGSPRSILKNCAPDENDRYATNYHNQRHMRRGHRSGRSGNKKTMKEKTKLVGRAVAKSLSNPINRLKHGMQRNGAKRVLAITRGR